MIGLSLLGLLCITLIGLYLLIAGITACYVTVAFTNRLSVPGALGVVIGAFLLYLSFSHITILFH